ncbi:MAG: HD domain-containing protein [Deltaproteobacteria bacterium]|jgi:HD-GYP domain-containing protein (c-di-GMP phosphodiesterase class II)|nr:HD domain-containing protein [Deltaproteobacteria bacterium]
MAEKEKIEKHSTGESLLHGLFRMIQVVKIHQSNNRLFNDILIDFKAALDDVWESGRPAAFSLYRGRFFLNDERIVYSPSMWATSTKMSEFFIERGINGLKFLPKDELTNEELVSMVDTLNQAKRFPDPFEWLYNQFDSKSNWVVPSKDEDRKISGSGAQELSEGGYKAVVQTEGLPGAEQQARKIYSQALTVLRGLVDRVTAGKKAGVQKCKRIVQELIDLMSDDWPLYLALSTIRDHEDQIFTHSINATILSMAIAQRIGYTKTATEQLGLTALFHDLGKAGDFKSTADKSDSLDNHDLAVIQNHTLGSISRIIRLNASFNLKLSLLPPVSEHHLGVDKSGYPQTGRDNELSLSGRILAVADQYDAMTSWRPWRNQTLSPTDAIKEMTSFSGTLLDPLVLRLFAEIMGPWPVGSLLILDSNELAMTKAVRPGSSPLPPAVLLHQSQEGGLLKGSSIELSECDENQRPKRQVLSCLSPVSFGIQPTDYLI